MISSALKNLISQHQLAVSGSIAYGYIHGSLISLTESAFFRRLSIYVGCVNITLPEGEELPPAAKCSALIVDMITKASGEENVYALLRNRLIPAIVMNHSGSVVTINFTRNSAGTNGLNRFVAEMLPRITPLTAPLQCSHCGGHTGGQGYPVKITGDAVVPMHSACLAESAKEFEAAHGGRNAWIRGVIGALLGASAGAVIWHLTGQMPVLAIITFILSELGYFLLKGRKGLLQWGIVAACSVIALMISLGFGWVETLHQQYVNYGSVVQGMMSEATFLKVSIRDLFKTGQALQALLLRIVFPLIIHALFHIFDLVKAAHKSEQRPKAMPGQA